MYDYNRIAASPYTITQAQTAARVALKKVRPQGRARTIDAIIKAISENDVVMSWLRYKAESRGHGMNIVSYVHIQDVLGPPLADWKFNHGLEGDQEYDDLSSDKRLSMGLGPLVEKYQQGELHDIPDYEAVSGLSQHLNRKLMDLAAGRSLDVAKDHSNALDIARQIYDQLKKHAPDW